MQASPTRKSRLSLSHCSYFSTEAESCRTSHQLASPSLRRDQSGLKYFLKMIYQPIVSHFNAKHQDDGWMDGWMDDYRSSSTNQIGRFSDKPIFGLAICMNITLTEQAFIKFPILLSTLDRLQPSAWVVLGTPLASAANEPSSPIFCSYS